MRTPVAGHCACALLATEPRSTHASAAGPGHAASGRRRTQYPIRIRAGRSRRASRAVAEGGCPTRPGRRRRCARGSRGVAEREPRAELWVDANALSQMMRNRSGEGISVQARMVQRAGRGQKRLHPIRYRRHSCGGSLCSPAQPAAVLLELQCVLAMKAGRSSTPSSGRLAIARATRLRGDDNYILRRGASCTATWRCWRRRPMAPPGRREEGDTGAVGRPQRFRMEISDGREIDLGQQAMHWEMARMLLDFVKPVRPSVSRGPRAGRRHGAPVVSRDRRVDAAPRRITTSLHLDHARRSFPRIPTSFS